MKKIAMVIAFTEFRDEEFFIPYNYWLDEFSVTVFSSQKGEAVGKLGGKFYVENVISEIHVDEFEAIVFIGGAGGYSYLGNKELKALINEFNNQGKLVAAICMAPLILAEAGILKGKKATVFVAEKERLESLGAKYTGHVVEQDDNIITGNGPLAVELFSKKIKEYING